MGIFSRNTKLFANILITAIDHIMVDIIVIIILFIQVDDVVHTPVLIVIIISRCCIVAAKFIEII